MSAAWVIALLTCFTFQDVPVVKAQEPWLGDGAPLALPSSFQPMERLDAPNAWLQELRWTAPSAWYGQVEGVWYDRTQPHVNVGYNLGAVGLHGNSLVDLFSGDNRALGTRDLDFSARPGLRFLVGRTIWADPCDDRGCVAKPEEISEAMQSLSIELGYLGLFRNYKASAHYTGSSPDSALISRFANQGPPNSFTPVLAPFDQATIASLMYRSRFDSAELNLRYSSHTSQRMPFDLLAGVRFVKLQENLDYMSANTMLASPLPMQPGLYTTRTDNDLIGLQVGGDLSYRLTSNLSLMGRGRGGLLVNSATQRSNVNGTLMASSMMYNDVGAGAGVGLASMFEFGIHTNYQLSPNLSLMVGYQGLFLSDLSTAPRQLNWNTEPGNRNALDRNGSLFFFGPAAGFEWRW
jgi:hypothetical protein